MQTIIIILGIAAVAFLAVKGSLKHKKVRKPVNVLYKLVSPLFKYGSDRFKLLKLMNDTRTATHPLLTSKKFNALAKKRVAEKIKEIKSSVKMSHAGFPNYVKMGMNLGADHVGENLSFGYGSMEGVVRGWESSKRHNSNMKDPLYDWVGLAIGKVNDRNVFVALFGGDDDIN